MNALKNLVELKELEDGNISVFDRKDEFEYELMNYEWSEDSKLVLRSAAHQYQDEDGEIYIDYTDYNPEGEITKSYTTDISGNIIEKIQNPTEPTTEPPTEPTTGNEEE